MDPSTVCLVDQPMGDHALEVILGTPIFEDCNRLVTGNGPDFDHSLVRYHFSIRKDFIRVVESKFWDEYFSRLKSAAKELLPTIEDFEETVVVPRSELDFSKGPIMRLVTLDNLIVDHAHLSDFHSIVARREKLKFRGPLRINVWLGELDDFEGYPGVTVHKLQ